MTTQQLDQTKLATFEQKMIAVLNNHLRAILEELLDELLGESPRLPGVKQVDTLTERELEVLRPAAAGQSNQQIAREHFLTLNTVKSHIHHIHRKLDELSTERPISSPSIHLTNQFPLDEPLSQRELEVLRLIAAGLSNVEIAQCLVIGVNTVKKHITHVYAKLNVTSRTQALLRARELKLI